jgi:hypothetical protein
MTSSTTQTTAAAVTIRGNHRVTLPSSSQDLNRRSSSHNNSTRVLQTYIKSHVQIEKHHVMQNVQYLVGRWYFWTKLAYTTEQADIADIFHMITTLMMHQRDHACPVSGCVCIATKWCTSISKRSYGRVDSLPCMHDICLLHC